MLNSILFSFIGRHPVCEDNKPLVYPFRLALLLATDTLCCEVAYDIMTLCPLHGQSDAWPKAISTIYERERVPCMNSAEGQRVHTDVTRRIVCEAHNRHLNAKLHRV